MKEKAEREIPCSETVPLRGMIGATSDYVLHHTYKCYKSYIEEIVNFDTLVEGNVTKVLFSSQ